MPELKSTVRLAWATIAQISPCNLTTSHKAR